MAPLSRAVVASAMMLVCSGVAQAQAQGVVFESAASAAGTNGMVAFSHTVGAQPDRFLVVGVTTTSSGSVAAVSYGGQNLTRIGGRGASNCRSELWGLRAPPSGTRMVQVNLAAPGPLVVGASSYSQVDPSDPTGPFASHSGSGSSPQDLSVSVAIEAGHFTVDVLCGSKSDGAPTPSVGDLQTQRWRRSTATMTGAGSTQPNVRSDGRATMSWTLVGSGTLDWVIATVPLKPSPPSDAGPDASPDVRPDLAPDLDPVPPEAGPDLAADLALADAGLPDAEPEAAPPPDLAGDTAEDASPPPTAEVRLQVGCACRTGGTAPGGGGLSLLAVLLLVRRRRGP